MVLFELSCFIYFELSYFVVFACVLLAAAEPGRDFTSDIAFTYTIHEYLHENSCKSK